RILLYDLSSGKARRQLTVEGKKTSDGRPWGFTVLAFSPDGNTLAAFGADESLHLWDPRTGQERPPIPCGRLGACGLAFSPDGKTLAAATYGHTIRLFDVVHGKELP